MSELVGAEQMGAAELPYTVMTLTQHAWLCPPFFLFRGQDLLIVHQNSFTKPTIMATPIIFGVGAIATALVGRQLFRSGVIGGKKAAEEWAKGGFRAKMDRKEAIAILGLKYVPFTLLVIEIILKLYSLIETTLNYGHS